MATMKKSFHQSRGSNETRNYIQPVLTAEDACAYMQCSRRFLERIVRSGRLPALKPTRKFLRFRLSDLDAFLQSGATMGA
jgi:excisionase family DNA binding protein